MSHWLENLEDGRERQVTYAFVDMPGGFERNKALRQFLEIPDDPPRRGYFDRELHFHPEAQ